MIKTHTLIADRISFADTDYTSLVVSASKSDSVLTAVIGANGTGGSLNFTLALCPTADVVSSDNDVKLTAVGANSTVNLIDGFELPVPANYTLHLKCSSATDTYAHALGLKATEGTLSVKAVIGS